MIRPIILQTIKRLIRSIRHQQHTYIDTKTPYYINIITEKSNLEGKVAIVTGGSGLIGRSISCRLAAEGAKVYVCGTSLDKAALVVKDIENLGGHAVPVTIDLSSEDDIKAKIAMIHEDNGSIDILVNSAGGSSREKNARIDQLSTDVIDTILNINLRGTILCCREVSKYMISKQSGKIICITSVIGEKGKAKFSEYAAAKAGIIAFVKSIAMELGSFHINVNCISPGIVPRGFITEQEIANLKKTNYLNDYGKPEGLANMAAYLVSDEAQFITGQNFIVDGGRSLGLKGD